MGSKSLNVTTALSLLVTLLQEANALSAAIRSAKEQGRDDLTDDEVATFAGRDDDARGRLQSRIDSLPKE